MNQKVIVNKKRPKLIEYTNVKDALYAKLKINIKKIIECEYDKVIVQKEKKEPELFSMKYITNEYKKQFNIACKQYKLSGIEDLDMIKKLAIFNTKQKIPYLHCIKCNDFKSYNIYSGVTCKYCDQQKTYNWMKKKRGECDVYRFISSSRTLISQSIKNQGYKKNSKTNVILGCDFETFKNYIERKFTKDMSWENYGKWHLDHIYPISKATSYEMALELNHYTNFQPLWAKDNFSKHDKVIEHQRTLAF